MWVFKAPDAIASNIVWKLPDTDGNPNDVLTTDGIGNTSWEPAIGDPSGTLDMSCNPIIDVSYIEWCDGTYIGPGSSFDISTNDVLKVKVIDSDRALVVDQSGNVGMGTAAPKRLLHIHNDISSSTYVQVTNAATGQTLAMDADSNLV